MTSPLDDLTEERLHQATRQTLALVSALFVLSEACRVARERIARLEARLTDAYYAFESDPQFTSIDRSDEVRLEIAPGRLRERIAELSARTTNQGGS